jgi:hypothetical protein
VARVPLDPGGVSASTPESPGLNSSKTSAGAFLCLEFDVQGHGPTHGRLWVDLLLIPNRSIEAHVQTTFGNVAANSL